MPLVFVHGVNVRKGELYDRELDFRNRHFREIFYKQLGQQVDDSALYNPYWGDLGATLSPELPFLPRGTYEVLWRKREQQAAAAKAKRLAAREANLASKTPLLDMARTASIADVIDLLWELAEREMIETGSQADYEPEQMENLAHRAVDFAHTDEGERWLQGLTSDDQLIERLAGLLHTGPAEGKKEASRASLRLSQIIKSAGGNLHEMLGETKQRITTQSQAIKHKVAEDISDTRIRLRGKVVSTTSHLFNDPLRTMFHEQCALLIGDAFAYFSSRGDGKQACPIAQRIIGSLQEASAAAKRTGEQLIAVGHSLGGVILTDIVTSFGKEVEVDVLITVGSQFPLFADLRMLPGIADSPRPIPRPDNVNRWINIFDPNDFLGYPASHVFEGVDDYHLPTYSVGAAAHKDYFNRRSFYFHLARRMLDYMPANKNLTAAR